MGGHALKGFDTKRLPKEEYEELSTYVLERLRSLFPFGRFAGIASYHQKQDFGDLDILASRSQMPENWQEMVLQVFQPRAHAINAKKGKDARIVTFSFEVQRFQVDLIFVESAEFDFAERYFAYNDLGNMIGRVAESLGVKLGYQGLMLPLSDKGGIFHKLVITRNFDDALHFLGYNPLRFRSGFDRLQDIFAYATSSSYARLEAFLLENRTRAKAARDATRPNYVQLLDWLKENPLPARELPSAEEIERRLYEHFPSVPDRIASVIAEREIEIAHRSRFNGHRISAITGLQGRELGEFMRHFVLAEGGRHAWRTTERQLDEEAFVARIRAFARQRHGLVALPLSSPELFEENLSP